MNIGIICEGKHSDAPALKVFLEAEFPHVTFTFSPTDKGVIFDRCGALVDELLKVGCQYVFVLWDLSPVGIGLDVLSQDDEEDPCRLDQRRTLLARVIDEDCECVEEFRKLQCRYGLLDGDIDYDGIRVELVCFSDSFDAVLLTDPALLRAVASSDIRVADPAPAFKDFEEVKSPESVLRRYFVRGHNKWFRRYNKLQHNLALAKEYVRRGAMQRLRLHPAYRRLVEKIERLLPTPSKASGSKMGASKVGKQGRRR